MNKILRFFAIAFSALPDPRIMLAADAASQEAVQLFQNGATRLGADIEAGKISKEIPPEYKLAFDLKKTDSLIQPVIGLLSLKRSNPAGIRDEWILELTYEAGYWKITKFASVIGETKIPEGPGFSRWKVIQSYFKP